MSEQIKYDYNDSVLESVGLNDVEEVEGINNIDDLDKIVEPPEEQEEQTQSVAPVEAPVAPVEAPVEPEGQSTKTDEVKADVGQLEEVLDTSKVEDLNKALHQARERTQQYKSSEAIKQQEIDLLKQQVDMLKQSSPKQEVQTETDFLSDLANDDVLTKEDLQVVMKQQKEQFQKEQDTRTQELQKKQAYDAAIEVNKVYGEELGDLSYKNVFSKFENGSIQLTEGQVSDINNATAMGKNPAELFYDYAINSDPFLKQKKFQLDVQSLINSKKNSDVNKNNQVKQQEINTETKLDLGLRLNSNIDNNMEDHIDKIVDDLY